MAERVAIIGAGIVGIAHAWREAVRGAEVTLFERSPRAQGASVRNFGMIWPIGQPAERLDTAMLSHALWDEFLRETGVWSHSEGSLHLATRDDEVRVLSEFASVAPQQGYRVRLTNAGETQDMCPAALPDRVIGGLFSETEKGVDPREVIATAPRWLEEKYGVTLRFDTTIIDVDLPSVRATDGRQWEFDRVTVATGADFATLYPELFAANALAKCKLQMMRTRSQPEGWRLGPMVASGLTLRHYPTFAGCPGIESLRRRVAEETPELDDFGIHVMAAQNGRGEVVLGDSHEYGSSIEPFDKELITQLMLRELKEILDLPDWSLAAHWHGIYAIQPTKELQFVHEPAPGVTIVISTGGCGMTMSFGLAERLVANRNGSSSTQVNGQPLAAETA